MFQISGQDEFKKLLRTGETYRKAARSAMKSVGYHGRLAVVDFIKNQGNGNWKSPGNISSKFKTQYNKRKGEKDKTRWKPIRKPRKVGLWASKFIRYRVSKDGYTLEITMDTTRKGVNPGAPIPTFFSDFLKRFQTKFSQPIKPKMRGFFGAMRRGRKKPKIGKNFFPLSKNKKTIINPKRDIFDTVSSKYTIESNRIFSKKLSDKLNKLLK